MRPTFNNAVEHCKDISNVHWADDERTYQDKCIDEFMRGGGEDSLVLDIFVILWLAGLLFSEAFQQSLNNVHKYLDESEML